MIQARNDDNPPIQRKDAKLEFV